MKVRLENMPDNINKNFVSSIEIYAERLDAKMMRNNIASGLQASLSRKARFGKQTFQEDAKKSFKGNQFTKKDKTNAVKTR